MTETFLETSVVFVTKLHAAKSHFLASHCPLKAYTEAIELANWLQVLTNICVSVCTVKHANFLLSNILTLCTRLQSPRPVII